MLKVEDLVLVMESKDIVSYYSHFIPKAAFYPDKRKIVTGIILEIISEAKVYCSLYSRNNFYKTTVYCVFIEKKLSKCYYLAENIELF